jgi:hypothetical protein
MAFDFVTVFALESQWLVADNSFALTEFCRVTFRTRDVGMSFAQSKPGTDRVIERDLVPGLCRMAGLATGGSSLYKLTGVGIFVTGRAGRCDTNIPYGIRLFVTLHTRHCGVLALERKLRCAVIKEK